jgi:hypothetical protein
MIASTIGRRLRPRLHQASRVAHRLLDGHVVAHPRQVADDERLRASTRDGGDVVRHVVDRDLERVVVAEHHHRE